MGTTFYYRSSCGERSARFTTVSEATDWATGLRLGELRAGVNGCALLGYMGAMDGRWQLIAAWEECE